MLIDLPEEVALCVCSFLDEKALCHLIYVCKQLQQQGSDPKLWKDLFESSSNKQITMVLEAPTKEITQEDEYKYWKYLSMKSHKYDSIPAAVAATIPGSQIHLREGLYQGSFDITKPIHIIGVGEKTKVVIKGVDSSNIITVALMDEATPSPPHISSSALLHGLTVQLVAPTAGHDAVTVERGTLFIDDCILDGNSRSCIYVKANATLIARKNIVSNGRVGLILDTCSADTRVEDNHFASSIYGVETWQSGGKLLRNHISGTQIGALLANSTTLLEENDISGANDGLQIARGSAPTLLRNKIHHNSYSGIMLFNSDGTYDGNEIYDNKYGGVIIKEQCNPRFVYNVVRNNSGGFWVHGNGHIENNVIEDTICIQVKGGTPTVLNNIMKEREPAVSKLVQDCIDRGECTFSVTAKDFSAQYYWNCETCIDRRLDICEACALACHKGHKLTTRVFSIVYCDCGAASCQRMPK